MSDSFEQRLRDAARAVPTPDAPNGLIERVVAERAGGRRVTLPTAQSVERWDTDGASWAPAGTVDRPGAYKLHGPLVRYGLCTEQDLAQGMFALGSSQVVKHLAAHIGAKRNRVIPGSSAPLPPRKSTP